MANGISNSNYSDSAQCLRELLHLVLSYSGRTPKYAISRFLNNKKVSLFVKQFLFAEAGSVLVSFHNSRILKYYYVGLNSEMMRKNVKYILSQIVCTR